MEEFLEFVITGFLAQLVDGALGMAYGLTSTSLLLSLGFPPLTASATTHAAECITTGFSAVAHHQFGNVSRLIFRSLLLPGILGAIIGAYILTVLDGDTIKPYISVYLLLMGLIVILKALNLFPPYVFTRHMSILGFGGGLLDAIGGGGWGPVVTSTLIASGTDTTKTIGSVNAVEFFVTLAASVTFFLSAANIRWEIVLGLAIGGAIAAPLGAWLCKHVPSKILMTLVGVLIVTLSIRTLWMSVA